VLAARALKNRTATLHHSVGEAISRFLELAYHMLMIPRSSVLFFLATTADSLDGHVFGKAAAALYSKYREVHCPKEVGSYPQVEVHNRHLKSQQDQFRARQEITNRDEPAKLFWLAPSGEEKFIASLQPFESVKLETWDGDRFIVRSEDSGTILLDLTVGVREVKLPVDMNCIGTPGLGSARKKTPPGNITEAATFRGWSNESPCDIVASWVWPNGTERWMADLLTGDGEPHHEVTYVGHDFVFRLADGRLVDRHKVAPALVQTCPTEAEGLSTEALLGMLEGLEETDQETDQGPERVVKLGRRPVISSGTLLGLLSGFKDVEDEANGFFNATSSASVDTSGEISPYRILTPVPAVS